MPTFCVDTNILIESWFSIYPPRIFKPLWDQLIEHRNELIIIEPIYNEIDSIPSGDKKLTLEKKKEKYPLRYWLMDNITKTSISHEINELSLQLELKYEISDQSKGAGQNDITLIAYAKHNNKIIVTHESNQLQKPQKKNHYKIPLICSEEKVQCIKFIELLDMLNIRIQ